MKKILKINLEGKGDVQNVESSMQNISKTNLVFRIIGVILSIAVAIFLNWLFTPALTFKSQGFWWYWIVAFGCATAILAGAEKIADKIYNCEHEFSIVLGFITAILFVITIILMFCSSDFIHAKKYAKLIEIEKGDFNADIQQIEEDSELITLDMKTAQQLGARAIGELENVSLYAINKEYNLTRYNGKYCRVTPLKYENSWIAYGNSEQGLPAYVVVDATKNEAQMVKLEENIKYSPNAFGKYNLKRYLRKKYTKYIFGSAQFELDEENNPYYIVPVMQANIGLFGGKTVSKFIIVDAITGNCEEKMPEEVPEWVEHAYSLKNLMDLAGYYYGYKNGFLGYHFGGTDVYELSYSYKNDKFDGYNSILINGEVNFFTGVVSSSGDESMIGFITANPRTGKITFYDCVGAEEGSGQSAAEALVQNYNYTASYPIIVNVDGEETYFMTLKDKTLNNKAYAFVNVKDYKNAVQAETLEVALQLYREKIGTVNSKPATSTETVQSKEGKIAILYEAIKAGNTNYFFKLEGDETLYVSSIEINSKQVEMGFGDLVEIEYVDADEAGVGIVEKIKIK